jgi:prephenate dehydrogenase
VIQRLVVVGVGLLGGSVARAARAHGLAREIVGVGRDAARLAPALADGTLDRAVTDVAGGVRDADLVVLAATVAANERLLPAVAAAVRPGTVITDVGSTKRGIVRVAERLAAARPLAFVGSHPMAGSERSGYAAARTDLFAGAAVIVTPGDASDAAAVKTVTGFWEALGARVSVLDPDVHDRVVALISHLPHLVADALVDAVVRSEPVALDFAGRGFKDTTRIAAADPRMWQEIFLANTDALASALVAFRTALADLERLVGAGDPAALEAALARIATARAGLV